MMCVGKGKSWINIIYYIYIFWFEFCFAATLELVMLVGHVWFFLAQEPHVGLFRQHMEMWDRGLSR